MEQQAPRPDALYTEGRRSGKTLCSQFHPDVMASGKWEDSLKTHLWAGNWITCHATFTLTCKEGVMFSQATVKTGLDACVRSGWHEMYGLHLSLIYHAPRIWEEQCSFSTKAFENCALGRLWGPPNHDHSNVGYWSIVALDYSVSLDKWFGSMGSS